MQKQQIENNINDLAQKIVPILRKGGVITASVFGSFARGENSAESDLDLLVEYRDDVSLFDVGGLKYELEKVLGCGVDLVSKKYLKPNVRVQILQDTKGIL